MALSISHPVRSPEWVLAYQGINITADISAMLLSVSYTDYLSELSSELEFVIEDHDQRWQAAWYPTLGDEISLSIGYRGEGLLPCGTFQIDQLELTGPPDTFVIRCLAAFITPAMRTFNSRGYEDQTLLGIAQSIGEKYGLAVISTPDVIDIAFQRITQKHETDLAFLKRLALEHGYDFTVRGSILVFYAQASLEAVAPVQTLTRTDLERFEFRNQTHNTYRAAEIAYQNFAIKSLIVQNAAASASIPTGDVLKLVSRCENGQHALLRAQAALHAHNLFFTEATLTMPGSIAMASGNTIGLAGFGEFDGNYLILVARHSLDRAHGYTTRLEVSHVF
jgi:phage protein D